MQCRNQGWFIVEVEVDEVGWWFGVGDSGGGSGRGGGGCVDAFFQLIHLCKAKKLPDRMFLTVSQILNN